ncbi:MAG TPA: DMT family transporter [Candidatus Binatia bacterium]|jgi:drug/metabolite transporter (DMT)-like permease|nr:DMT family transporter [Candidatus Binatia bacterium]
MVFSRDIRRRVLADVALLVPVIVWATNFTVVRQAMLTWGGARYSFLAARFWLATLALIPFIIWRPQKEAVSWREYVYPGILVGISLVIAYSSQTAALVYSTASKTAFITSTSVIIVPVVAALMLKEIIRPLTVIGVILAFIGLALLCLKNDYSVSVADGFSLICAVALAADVLIISRYAGRLNPLRLTAVSTFLIALVFTLASIFYDLPRGMPPMNSQVAFAILFTGLIATALCFWIQAKAQRFTTATHAALIFSLEPAIAAFVGFLWSDERLTIRAIFGSFLILSGNLIAELGGIMFPVSHRIESQSNDSRKTIVS